MHLECKHSMEIDVDAIKSVYYCLILHNFILSVKLNCVNCVVMSLMVIAKRLLHGQWVHACILSNCKAIMPA